MLRLRGRGCGARLARRSGALADDRFYDGFAVFDHDVEVDFAIFVLLAEFGFGGADGFCEAFEGDVCLLGLLLRLLKARVQVAQA